jgi:hypothetical protein
MFSSVYDVQKSVDDVQNSVDDVQNSVDNVEDDDVFPDNVEEGNAPFYGN